MKLSKYFPFYGHGDALFNIFGHPYFIARISLNHEIKQFASMGDSLKILDVGCGGMPYKKYFPYCVSYEGLEIDQERNRENPNVTYFYDGGIFPISNDQYDCIVCSQVLEHTFDPDLLLEEIRRVSRNNGLLILTVPFLWPEHEQPFDSQRYTSYGLLAILQRHGYVIRKIKKLNCGFSGLIQLVIAWIESLVAPFISSGVKRTFLWRLLTLLPYSVANLIAFASEFCSTEQSGSSFFLDLVVFAEIQK